METTEGGLDNKQSQSGLADQNAASAASNALDVAIDLLEDIQRVVGNGKPKSLRVKFGEKTIAELPIALTAAAAFAAGLAAVLVTKLAIEIQHEER